MNECYAAHCIKPVLETDGITEENIQIVLGEHKIKDKTVMSGHDKWDKQLNR